MESRDEAAPSHRTWKTPPNHHPRFPHLPQPLLKKERFKGRTKSKPFIPTVTYVPGPMCYLCSRLHSRSRMRGHFTVASTLHKHRSGMPSQAGHARKERVSPILQSPLIRLRHLLPPQKARGEKALDLEELRIRMLEMRATSSAATPHTRRGDVSRASGLTRARGRVRGRSGRRTGSRR